MKRPVLQYACLIAVLAVTLVYQVPALEFNLPQLFPRMKDFLSLAPERAGLEVVSSDTSARRVGVRGGDILVAVNGKPLTGIGMFGQAVAKAHPGDKLRLTLRTQKPHGQPAERTVTYVTKRSTGGSGAFGVFSVIMPIFCLILGFWVAAVRPRDPLAWLLLALLLSFATFANPGVEYREPWLRDFGTAYHYGLASTWPIWMFLFGIYFPEPLSARAGWCWWHWSVRLKWVLVVPLAVFAVVNAVIATGVMESYASVAPLIRASAPFDGIATILMYVATSAFFCFIFAKGSMATSRDAKRRLRLLYFGTCISLTPVFVLFLISTIAQVPMEDYFPRGLLLFAYSLLFLFPLTLAYVIVVQRAMDVRVVIRRGLQYALAKNGILALRIIILGLLGFLVFDINRHLGRDPILPWFVVGVGVGLAITIGRLTKRLRTWTDRKFFRDAYNAEIVLSDLGEKVRTIVETHPLMDTVCRTIADTLHVPNIAVLLRQSAEYRPAYALGYGSGPEVAFPDEAATVKQLAESREPARIYLDDENSWVYRTAGLTDEERKKLAALHAQLLLPLSVKNKLLGFISLGEKRSEAPYSGSDLRLLKSVAAQTGLALENAQLSAAMVQEVARREKLSRELEIAREVQERLFPQKLPPVEGLDYCGTCRTALGVGGDYFDFLALPGGRLGIAVGDVSGKGIAAALMMASLQASLRGEAARADSDLSSLVASINRMVYEASSSNRYATFFYGQYEPRVRCLTYVNAGHNPPLIFKKAENRVVRLEAGGTVIGLLEDACYAQDSVTLAPGDVLVAYTDGITEAMNPNDEEWGEERFVAAVESALSLPAAGLAAHIMEGATLFAAGAPQHDDMTLVILRVVA